MPGQAPKTDWKLFAWHGLRCEVPEAWELGAVTGDGRKGSLRIDDEELARLEVRWESGRARTALEPVVERHIADLEKAARKAKLSFSVDRDARIATPENMQAMGFEWKSDFKAFNLLTFCPECHRIVLLRAIARQGERLRPIAARIFESFRDHPEGAVPWAVYGLRLEAPARFELERHTLNLQRIELVFRDGSDRAAAARFSLADLSLRGKTLRQWIAATYGKELADLNLDVEEGSYRGCESIELSGRLRRTKIQGLLNPKLRFAGRVWHSEAEDKIYVARWRSRGERIEEFACFCDSVGLNKDRV